MKRRNLPPKSRRCPRCHEPKRERQAYCDACEDLETCRPGIFQEAGYRLCARCLELGKSKREATFWSQHCRKITRCEDCRAWMNEIEDSLGLYGHRYVTMERPVRNGGSFDRMRQQLQRHVGTMTADKQAQIYAEEQAAHYRGIPFRRLTPEEIAREYPPERVAAILERAQRNWETNRHVPHVVQL